jgi:ribosomal protein S18 acetylase RimI-like enzyme
MAGESGEESAYLTQVEANFWEFWSTFGSAPGCSLHEDHAATWFETPLPMIPYNGVVRFHVPDQPHLRIDPILQHFKNRKVAFMWVVHPSSLPLNLTNLLEERGLIDVEPIYGMARDLSHLPDIPSCETGIDIRKVVNERDAGAWHQFAAWRWHIPPSYQDTYATVSSQFRVGTPGSNSHVWQAWRDGQPVAKAASFLGSGSVGIYAVATKPEARRLGLARILTLTALSHARDSGCRLAVLHSTPMAKRLYESIGFSTLGEFRLFASEKVLV